VLANKFVVVTTFVVKRFVVADVAGGNLLGAFVAGSCPCAKTPIAADATTHNNPTKVRNLTGLLGPDEIPAHTLYQARIFPNFRHNPLIPHIFGLKARRYESPGPSKAQSRVYRVRTKLRSERAQV
jgi:hypothetical protein